MLGNLKNNRNEWLFLFLAADILFIVIHLLHSYSGYFQAGAFSLKNERGLSEGFMYLKEYWIVLMTLRIGRLRSERAYFAWSLLFLYLLLDDSMAIHENIGQKLSEHLNFSSFLSLRANDFGELLVSAATGAFFLGLILIAYYFGSEGFKKFSRIMIALLLLLAVFGVFFDMIHIILKRQMEVLFAVLEDGGELITMTLICVFVFNSLVSQNHLNSETVP